MVKLIERDQETTKETKERQKGALEEVMRFCSNKTDCRRTQILSFFNEKFDPANCHRGCDICIQRENNIYHEEDVTEDTKTVLRMMEAFNERDRITVKNAVDCFRGRGGGSGKNLNQNRCFGAGKDWAKEDAERLIQLLVIEGALEEYYVANSAGWNNSYLQVRSILGSQLPADLQLGKTARLYLSGEKRLQMSFKAAVATNKRSKTAKPRTAKNGQQGIQSFTKQVSNPVSRKRSAQQIMQEEQEFDNSKWGDTDEEYIDDPDTSSAEGDRNDPIEPDDTDVDEDVSLAKVQAAKKRKLLGERSAKFAPSAKNAKANGLPWAAPATTRAKGRGSELVTLDEEDVQVVDDARRDNQSPTEQCLKDLRAVVEKAS